MSKHIENRNGLYYVRATRISLDSIVYAFRQGTSLASIREDYEGLSLADVYGAIAYYRGHQAEVDAYLARRRREYAELERTGTPPGADLKARLERARQATSPLPE